MADALVCVVVLGFAGLAVWRVLRRPKAEFCAMCSCTGCPNRGGGECHCGEK